MLGDSTGTKTAQHDTIHDRRRDSRISYTLAPLRCGDMTQTVTIGIPTYNRADRYLRPAIECALAQTWDNLEIIVSDNNSTDKTMEVVCSYDDPRLRYVRQETNIGPNNNFNYCVNNAAGNYFLLFHDDDAIDPDMVSSCMAAVGDDGRVIREIPNRAGGMGYNEYFRAWMRDGVTGYVCSTLFNTRMLREIGGFQSANGLYQDIIAAARLMARGGRADVEEVKASFRRHDDNYGNTASLSAWCEDASEAAQTIASEAKNDGEALHREALRYLSRLLYQKVGRIVPDRWDRLQAYRLISKELDGAYPWQEYLYQRTIGMRLRPVRRLARRWVRGSA